MKKYHLPQEPGCLIVKRLIIASTLFVFLFNSCIKEDLSQRKRSGDGLNIYLVKGNYNYTDLNEDNLNIFETESEPWLSHDEIDFYDWSAHIFYLKQPKEREKYAGRYFIVKAGNESLFFGYFHSPFSSAIMTFLSILAHDSWYYSANIIELDGINFYLNPESEEMLKFKNTLKKSGLFREGIEVDLLDVKRKNSTTIEYTFEVTNKDIQSTYVLDPNKMGSAHFHYYMNGVTLRKGDDYYFAENKTTSGVDINNDSYYCIKSDQSKIWTVTLDGFTSLPEPEGCTASLNFNGYSTDDGWEKSDGRIWIGNIIVQKDF